MPENSKLVLNSNVGKRIRSKFLQNYVNITQYFATTKFFRKMYLVRDHWLGQNGIFFFFSRMNLHITKQLKTTTTTTKASNELLCALPTSPRGGFCHRHFPPQ